MSAKIKNLGFAMLVFAAGAATFSVLTPYVAKSQEGQNCRLEIGRRYIAFNSCRLNDFVTTVSNDGSGQLTLQCASVRMVCE